MQLDFFDAAEERLSAGLTWPLGDVARDCNRVESVELCLIGEVLRVGCPLVGGRAESAKPGEPFVPQGLLFPCVGLQLVEADRRRGPAQLPFRP